MKLNAADFIGKPAVEAAKAAIEKFAGYLEGKDATTIERHWNVMHRFSYFQGLAVNAAISAIDIALGDIKGKALGPPVYQWLGGAVRTRVGPRQGPRVVVQYGVAVCALAVSPRGQQHPPRHPISRERRRTKRPHLANLLLFFCCCHHHLVFDG